MPPVMLMIFAAISGCTDTHLKRLSVGMPRDSVNALMGTNPPHRAASYLTAGKTWDVLMFAPRKAAASDSIPWRKLNVVVLANGRVVGWGWSWWEKFAPGLAIPLPPMK